LASSCPSRMSGFSVSIRSVPVLVGLQSEQDAAHLSERAKGLRRSSDETVSRSVYINPKLSPDEFRLAHEARCRRRERHQYGRRQPPSAANSSLSAGAAVFRPTTAVTTSTPAAAATTDDSAAGGGPSSAATDGRHR